MTDNGFLKLRSMSNVPLDNNRILKCIVLAGVYFYINLPAWYDELIELDAVKKTHLRGQKQIMEHAAVQNENLITVSFLLKTKIWSLSHFSWQQSPTVSVVLQWNYCTLLGRSIDYRRDVGLNSTEYKYSASEMKKTWILSIRIASKRRQTQTNRVQLKLIHIAAYRIAANLRLSSFDHTYEADLARWYLLPTGHIINRIASYESQTLIKHVAKRE